MSEFRDRLERLAARGSRRGADDVLSAAMRGAPKNEVNVVPDDNSGDLPIIDDDVPFVTSDVEPRRRSRYGTLVATFGIAALVGVGALAIASVFGNGGAASPEGAVRQLADAISHKDPLAAVDVLAPTEVRSMRDTVNSASHRAADLKIVDNASAPFTGVDLSVDHLQLSTQPLADGYTKVTVTGGEVSAATHTTAMSKLLQDSIRNSGSGNAKGNIELAKIASDADLPTFVVTVRHDGRWYVSPAYTALEYAREADGGPAAEFGSGKTATDLGSDTPDHAVTDALHAWQAGNWDRLMALAPPDELPVYDYRKWLGQLGAENEPDFTIDKLTTSSTTNGDTGTVKLDASGTMGSGQDQGKWQVGGTCSNTYGGWYSYDSSFANASPSSSGTDGQWTDTVTHTQLCLAGDLSNVVPFGLIPLARDGTAAPSGSVSVYVVRENGRWFVSPVTTALKVLDSTIQHLDERSVYSFLGLAYELPPDGNITLGQPFTVPNHGGILNESVFAFEGTKDQEVIGEINGNNRFYASGQVYTADGKQVDYVEFSTVKDGFAFPVTLPSTGSYRLVVSGSLPKDSTLTLWDAKDAPKGLTSQLGATGDETCTSTIGGGESCSGSGSSPSSGGDSSCTIANNKLTCDGVQLGAVCPDKGAAAKDGCISPSDAESLLPPNGSVTATTSGAAGHAAEATPAPHTTVAPTPTPTVAAMPNTAGVPTSVP